MAAIHITDIESAINFWRERSPSPDGITAGPISRMGPDYYVAMVHIAPNATPGARSVTAVFDSGEMATLPESFTVLARPTATRSTWDLYP